MVTKKFRYVKSLIGFPGVRRFPDGFVSGIKDHYFVVGVFGLVLLHFGLGTRFRDEIIMRKRLWQLRIKKESAIVQFRMSFVS